MDYQFNIPPFISVYILLVYISALFFMFYYVVRQLRKRQGFLDKAKKILEKYESKPVSNYRDFRISRSEKTNILLEHMNYSEKLKSYVEANVQKYRAELFLWDSYYILKYLNIVNGRTSAEESAKWKLELQQFDIISLPYFALQEAVNEGFIISIEEYISMFPGRSNEFKVFESILSNNENLFFIKDNSKYYGVPFTEISVVLAYNDGRRISSDLEELAESAVSFGMLDKEIAGSHYYQFLNFTGYYGKNFLQFQDEYNENFFHELIDEKFKKALMLYLKFYLKSYKHRGNWASMLDELRLGTFNCCFLWTEQLTELEKYSYLKYSQIRLSKYKAFYQADGWFIALVKKDNLDSYKDTLLQTINRLVGSDFQKELQLTSWSSPFTELYGGQLNIENEEESTIKSTWIENSKEIKQILSKSKQKANIPCMWDFIVNFSIIIQKACVGKKLQDIDSVYNDCLSKITELITDTNFLS